MHNPPNSSKVYNVGSTETIIFLILQMRKYRDSLFLQVVIELRFNPYLSSGLKIPTHNML